jgi:hypothetical protein
MSSYVSQITRARRRELRRTIYTFVERTPQTREALRGLPSDKLAALVRKLKQAASAREVRS